MLRKTVAVLSFVACSFLHAADVIVETDDFRLTVGHDAKVKSLTVKATGEECCGSEDEVSLFTATQDRPFNNEIKLIQPNRRTVYPAVSLRREGEFLIAGFEHRQYEAKVRVRTAAHYAAFELVDFICDRKTTYDYLKMDIPPVASFRVLQLPVLNRRLFGNWLNVSWDEKAAVCIAGATPHPDVGHEPRKGHKIFYAELMHGIRLRGGSAALIAAPGREAFLDAMDSFERDFSLPRGVASRRGNDVNEPIFHTSGFAPLQIDELLGYVRKGGFRLMTFSYFNVVKEKGTWRLCGDYDWRDDYPRGEEDLRSMLAKVKAAGVKPGLHTLHTHIGLESRYVTPVADPRLNKTRRFTLLTPLSADTNDTEITVQEPTADTPMYPSSRILQFGGELLSYESYTTEPPYRFLGVKRAVHKTRPAAHPYGEVGGILDVSEYGAPGSCYLDQNSDLQDEVARKLARIYKCGFEYVYLDGSEGVNRPFNYHVANSQYRYWKLLDPEPSFGEGAAKTHFGWHMLGGANAFDCFAPEVFKAKIAEFPCAQAPITWQDMSRVDFGWWELCVPSNGDKPSIGTQPDMWEYAVSKAVAWDCAASVLMSLKALKAHPRTEDILVVMRRWGDARRAGLVTHDWKLKMRDTKKEFHLIESGTGGCEIVEWAQIPVAGSKTGPVRAFLYEKDSRRHVVYWHATAPSGVLDLGGSHGKLQVAGQKTWTTGLSRDEVISLFDKAVVLSE